MKRMTKFMIAVVIGWITLLFFMFAALVQVARADAPKQIVNGEYIICEINTQDNAVEINEAPPINRLSEALDATETAQTVYGGITLTQEETDLLRAILALESQGEGLTGQKAVVEVIFNRILSDKWPDDLKSVIYQRGQFATVKYLKRPYAVPGEAEDDAISEVLRETETVLPSMDYVYFSRGKSNGKAFTKINHHWFSR